jgi:hypothetical protein
VRKKYIYGGHIWQTFPQPSKWLWLTPRVITHDEDKYLCDLPPKDNNYSQIINKKSPRWNKVADSLLKTDFTN